MTKKSLQVEVAEAIILYERTIGHSATRTRQMIENGTEISVLSQLMKSADLQKGFKSLRDANLLESTFEAIVVRHSELFSEEVVEAAKWRLNNSHDLL